MREALIRAAAEMLKEKSAEQISLREIARACGVSEAAPYRHFKDRQDILSAIGVVAFDLLRAEIVKVAESKSSPEEKFIRVCLAYLAMGRNHPEHLKLIFGPSITPSPEYPELFKAGKLAFLSLVRVMQECQRGGIVSKGDLFQKAMHVWMAIHGFTMLYVDCRCEWLGLDSSTSEKAMRDFAKELLVGFSKGLEPGRSGFVPHAIGITEELLREAGIDAEIRVSFSDLQKE